MLQPIKQTPLHTLFTAQNAQFTQLAGWQVVERFDDVARETAVAHQAVALADQTPNGKIRLEGAQAGKLLGSEALAINDGIITDFGNVYRLRRDLFFIHTPPEAVEEVIEQLETLLETAESHITLTNVTHGQAELWLIGSQSAELLSFLCGLDFHKSQFPNQTAKQSSVAKTSQLVIRHDLAELPAYALIGGRSFGAYLWQTILEAGKSLGIQPIGQAAMANLNEIEC